MRKLMPWLLPMVCLLLVVHYGIAAARPKQPDGCNLTIDVTKDAPVMRLGAFYNLGIKITNRNELKVSIPSGWDTLHDYRIKLENGIDPPLYLEQNVTFSSQLMEVDPSDSVVQSYDLNKSAPIPGSRSQLTAGKYRLSVIRSGDVVLDSSFGSGDSKTCTNISKQISLEVTGN